MKRILSFIFGIMAVALAANLHAEAKLIDRVVALVDEDVVLASELVRRTNAVIDQIKSREQTVPSLETLREQVLDRLVIESLQIQMARRAGVRVSDVELDEAIDKISQQNQLSTSQLKSQVEKDGVSWALFREDVRDEIMVSRVTQGIVSRRIQISDKEVDNLLEQINRQGLSQTQYLIGHILLPLSDSTAPEELNQVRDQATKIVSELRNGASFEEYAVSYSKGQNALSGGSLGWRGLSQLPSLFADTVKNMQAGEVSEPLRSGSGLHILRLAETKGGFEKSTVVQTHVRHILIQPDAITDDKAALEKAQLIYQKIKDGEDFAELAIQHSDDKGSGSLGGDLKWTDPGTFVPEFTQAMDQLAVNEMSQPVKSEFGYHIIEVLGRRDQDQTEDKLRERAYRILHNRKFEEEVQIWLREIKNEAYIKTLLDDA